MSAYLSPVLNEPQPNANGAPLAGGKIFTYLAGSSTPAATYTTSAGNVAQANPIVLNSRGTVDNPIWLTGGTAYKFILTDASLVPVNPGFDNVQGVNDPSTITAPDQWVPFGATPTFLSTTSFSVVGDQTGTFHVGRRVKAQCSGGTVYCAILTTVFSAGVTTVTVTLDTVLTLDSGLSAVSYGLLTYTNPSIPRRPGELTGVQVITVTGTYTPTPGTNSVIVELIGGGGGGGGTVATGASQMAAGAGGSAGGYAKSRLTSGFSGVTVTIGAGGTVSAGTLGGSGGTTSFGAVFSATGGGGGGAGSIVAFSATAFSSPNPGGAGTAGNLCNGSGGLGGFGLCADSNTSIGGSGGASHIGGGGLGQQTSAGNPATSAGAGGSGAASVAGTAARSGGTGGNGICIIQEYA